MAAKRRKRPVSAPSRARSSSTPVRKPKPRSKPSSPRAQAPSSSSTPEPSSSSASTPSVGGRPTLYDIVLQERICALIEAGVSIAGACKQEHIGKRTLYDWRARGKLGEQPYARFATALDAALGRAESNVVRLIVASTAEDWRAGAWWLERRFPKLYGAKQQLKLEKAPADMTDDELDAIIAKHGYVHAASPLDTTADSTEI